MSSRKANGQVPEAEGFVKEDEEQKLSVAGSSQWESGCLGWAEEDILG